MGRSERKKKKDATGEDEEATSTLVVGPQAVTRPAGVQDKKLSLLGSLDSCNACIRYILIVGNCIFFFLGCTVIGLGIYVVVDKVNFVTGVFGLTLVAPASYLIIASGCVVFIISFIGCFGSLFESRLLLAIYSTSLSVVLVLSCVGFVFAVLFRSKVTDQIRIYMNQTIHNDYGVNPDQQWNYFVTESWDKAQTKWQCCAVKDDTWSIYYASSWYRRYSRGPVVPSSCCRLDDSGAFVDFGSCQRNYNERPPDNSTADFVLAINTRGCYEEGRRVMKEISGYLICIGVVTATLVIGGLALSIRLARNV